MNSLDGNTSSCRPSARQHRGAPNPHGPPAPWNGSPSRTNRAETRSSCAEVYAGVLGPPLRVHGAKTELTLAGGTEGSNPFPSSGESKRHPRPSTGAPTSLNCAHRRNKTQRRYPQYRFQASRLPANHHRDTLDLRIQGVAVDEDLLHDGVLAGRQPLVELDRKCQIFPRKRDADECDPAVGVQYQVPAFRCGAFANRCIDEPHRLAHNLIIAH